MWDSNKLYEQAMSEVKENEQPELRKAIQFFGMDSGESILEWFFKNRFDVVNSGIFFDGCMEDMVIEIERKRNFYKLNTPQYRNEKV